MRMLVTGLVAATLCLTLASAQAEEQAPDGSGIDSSKTHDIRVIVHNDTSDVIYAFYDDDDGVSDPIEVKGNTQENVTWTISGCPGGNNNNKTAQASVLISTSSSTNVSDGIGYGDYYYENEQNGCHLKFKDATVEPAFRDQYELKDKNDTHSEHDRDLILTAID